MTKKIQSPTLLHMKVMNLYRDIDISDISHTMHMEVAELFRPRSWSASRQS